MPGRSDRHDQPVHLLLGGEATDVPDEEGSPRGARCGGASGRCDAREKRARSTPRVQRATGAILAVRLASDHDASGRRERQRPRAYGGPTAASARWREGRDTGIGSETNAGEVALEDGD